MNILVTGGAGFIGSALCRHLVSIGENVLNVDKLTYAGNLASLWSIEKCPNYRFVNADICNEAALIELMRRQEIDRVIHLAAETHVDRSIDGPAQFIETNIVGTFRLLQATLKYWRELPDQAARNFRFHHVSTDEVFGDLPFDDSTFDEQTPYAPSSPYSASKAASDHLVRAWHQTFGLPIVMSNCSNNYGPYHFPEKLIPLVILNALDEKPLPIYGAGMNVRDWLYVEDHARALFTIASRGRPGEKYNVGGRNERRNIDVVEHICAILDSVFPGKEQHSRLIANVTDRPGHDARYAIDATKLETELGWKAEENFDSGIEKTVRWYLDNEWWWRPLRDNVYSGERLGTFKGR